MNFGMQKSDDMNLLLASTSTVHGAGYLAYFRNAWTQHFSNLNGPVVFIPYARPGGISWDEYTAIARKAFVAEGIELKGIHEFDSPEEACQAAGGFFTGGGNTFVLLKTLQDLNVMPHLDHAVRGGKPYMGTSAGSNIAGQNVRTTNDMPIVYPSSFDAMGWIPHNINPHYLDPDPGSTHMGETRETRINEFHHYNDLAVIGLREGSWLQVHGEVITLCGPHRARIFRAQQTPDEFETGSKLNTL